MRKKEMAAKIEELEASALATKKMLKSQIDLVKEWHEYLGRQVNCAEDYGHEYVFASARNDGSGRYGDYSYNYQDCIKHGFYPNIFTYKCSRCGRTVDYKWDELSTKEKNALKTLGVVKGE
jgi:hypothetical protein